MSDPTGSPIRWELRYRRHLEWRSEGNQIVAADEEVVLYVDAPTGPEAIDTAAKYSGGSSLCHVSNLISCRRLAS